MNVNWDDKPVIRHSGNESFHISGTEIASTLLGFWQWHGSDLANNALRGKLAEYLVGLDLGCVDSVRTEWDEYDFITSAGIKVEVKSAAYLQSWSQLKLSSISFGIPGRRSYDESLRMFGDNSKRRADVYVFALLHHQHKPSLDPLDLDQWSFYVIRTLTLDQVIPNQKTLSFSTLLALNPIEVAFGGIRPAIDRMFSNSVPSDN